MEIRKCRNLAVGLMIFLAVAVCVWAQTQTEGQQIIKKEVTVTTHGTVFNVAVPEGTLPQGATFTWVASEMGFESKVVKGVPFSADTVTEFTQTLSNGQRLYRKTTGDVCRDSEGRTRREQTIEAIGGYSASSPARQTIFINDPVSGTSYILDSGNHTAVKTSHVSTGAVVYSKGGTGYGVASGVGSGVGGGVSGGVQTGEQIIVHIIDGVTGGGAQVMTSKIHSPTNSRTESLGTQVIEGVAAEGTRTIETIPTGTIGNDSPIEILSERWYSPELQVVLKTRHSDPRSGENVYQLTNIRRGEPSPTMFQIPAEFTIKDGPALQHSIEIKKKDDNR
jgi:hypothetical protein